MTARIPAGWSKLLAPIALELRFAAILELSRAGVLAALDLDLRAAAIFAADVSAPGTWQVAEEKLRELQAAPAEDGWSAWAKFCADADPVELDYRALLAERYER